MSTAQPHDYATMPFGVHDASDDGKPKTTRRGKGGGKTKKEDDMGNKRAAAVARLQRPEIGATPAQAEQVVDSIGVDVITAESDAALKDKVAAAVDAAYNPADYNIKQIKEYVGDDVEKATQVLAAEQARGEVARPSLVEYLQKLSAPSSESDTGKSEADGGAETSDGEGADSAG